MNDAWTKYINRPKPEWGQVVADDTPVDEEYEKELDRVLTEQFEKAVDFQMEPDGPPVPVVQASPAQGWRRAIRDP